MYFSFCMLTTFFNLKTQERAFVLKVSALEIYNESVIDLLNRESGHLRLLDDPEVAAGFWKMLINISSGVSMSNNLFFFW